ncbi:MAG: glycosyltransferase family 4 protein [Alphaproteobacteria bacterium]|nr:glycosyltransferase family 4 protein [Alphaproteobacteria bacterium]
MPFFFLLRGMAEILHVCSGKGLGGTRTVFLAHQRVFDALGVETTPLIRRGALIGEKLPNASIVNYFRRIPVKWQRAYSTMRTLAGAHDLIWVHKPVDCHIWRTVAPQAKIVMVVHGFQNTNLEKADYLVPVSVPVLEHLRAKGLRNTFLVNNFLPTELTFPDQKVPWNDELRISSFGFFRRKKGFSDLIKAVGILQNEYGCRNFQANLFGNGRLSPVLRLQKKFLEAENLSINGWTENMPTELLRSDIVVIPSRSESFSMVAIEAMAAGCLVISTRCGGPEFIISDGYDGILVEKQNPQALAAKIREVIDHPEQFSYMRENAIKTVAQKFSLKSAKDVISEVLRRMRF